MDLNLSNPSSAKTCGHTGAGVGQCALSILPVKVKAPEGNIVVTYAFLDPGSSATFCSEELMKKMNVTGKRTPFFLHTMGHEAVVPAFCLTGFEVAGLEDHTFYPLPDVFTQKKMPVTLNNMITLEQLSKWPHLSEVNIPTIKADVGMLIGTNMPVLVEPLEVIPSNGNGPYATRTVLGWVVSGPMNGNAGTVESVVNGISFCKLEDIQINQEICAARKMKEKQGKGK